MQGKLLPLLLLVVSAPASAQQAVEQQQQQSVPQQRVATPRQIRAFVANFQAGVSSGCIRNPPKDIKVPRSYCECYAKAFVERYAPNDLIAMNNLAELYPRVAPAAIGVMMRPESLACAASQPLPSR